MLIIEASVLYAPSPVRWTPTKPGSGRQRFVPVRTHTDERETRKRLLSLDQEIDAIIDAPLNGTVVDLILGITSRERLRWSKDGRLPTSGRGVIGCGNHGAHVPLFPYEGISRIAGEPSLIETWREADRQSRKA